MKKNKKILIIEDDRVLVSALKYEMEECGFNVTTYLEGQGALEKAVSEKPDLVLLDLVLPGVHGFEILKKLKEEEKTKNIPVIVVTNLGEESDRRKSLSLGALDYFVKASVDLSELSKKIKKIFKIK